MLAALRKLVVDGKETTSSRDFCLVQMTDARHFLQCAVLWIDVLSDGLLCWEMFGGLKALPAVLYAVVFQSEQRELRVDQGCMVPEESGGVYVCRSRHPASCVSMTLVKSFTAYRDGSNGPVI